MGTKPSSSAMAVLALHHGDISPAPADLNSGDKVFQSFCTGSVSQPRDSPLLNNNLAQRGAVRIKSIQHASKPHNHSTRHITSSQSMRQEVLADMSFISE